MNAAELRGPSRRAAWLRVAAWVLLAVVVAAVLVVANGGLGGSGKPTEAGRVHRLASQLRCVECQSLSVADSDTPVAQATRADLQQRVAAGQTDAQIREAYVRRYGPFILLQPSSSGIGLLVWALPIGLVVVAAGGLALAIRRWQRQPRLAPSTADEELVDRARDESVARRRRGEVERE